MKDDLRYTPSDCFETFPFPKNAESDPALESAGKAYYEYRADLMIRNNEGLTKTYNRFHDPDERSPDIVKLRELHAAMDRAVLDAYGWTDLKPTCEFLLDYEEDDDDDTSPTRERVGSQPDAHGDTHSLARRARTDLALRAPTLTGHRRRKRPWRYRWPDDLRDEVLARLLELNRQRAEEERLSGAAAESANTSPKRKRVRRNPKSANPHNSQSSLFDE